MNPFEWIKSKLQNKNYIESIDIKDGVLHIMRKNGVSFNAICIKDTNIDTSKIKNRIENIDVNFVLATNRDVIIDGGVYTFLEESEIVIGDFKDLFRVISQNDNFPYLNPTVKFILQGLRQHDRVKSVERLDNNRYLIHRHFGDSITILSLEDYNITIQNMRDSIDKYKNAFQAVLKANPNGGIAESASIFAESKNLKILKWGELLGDLNRVWT